MFFVILTWHDLRPYNLTISCHAGDVKVCLPVLLCVLGDIASLRYPRFPALVSSFTYWDFVWRCLCLVYSQAHSRTVGPLLATLLHRFDQCPAPSKLGMFEAGVLHAFGTFIFVVVLVQCVHLARHLVPGAACVL